jgi:hypothetical protein
VFGYRVIVHSPARSHMLTVIYMTYHEQGPPDRSSTTNLISIATSNAPKCRIKLFTYESVVGRTKLILSHRFGLKHLQYSRSNLELMFCQWILAHSTPTTIAIPVPAVVQDYIGEDELLALVD